jgi:nitrogen fixation protein FixH
MTKNIMPTIKIIAVILIAFLACYAISRAIPQIKIPLIATKEDKQKMQDALGWGSELLVDRRTEKPANIRFMLRNKQREPIINATVHITLSQINGKSISLPLIMDEAGVYRGEIPLPQSGVWDANTAVQIGTDTYQVTDHFTLK